LGRAVHLQGDYRAARALYDESLGLRQRLGDREGLGMCLALTGMLAFHEGKHDEARLLGTRALAMAHELRYGWVTAVELAQLAALDAATGLAERAVRLAAAAARLAGALAVQINPDYRVALDSALDRAQRELGPAAYAALWAEGQAMTTDQAVAYAL